MLLPLLHSKTQKGRDFREDAYQALKAPSWISPIQPKSRDFLVPTSLICTSEQTD